MVPASGEEPFRVLFETSPVGMALAAADGKLTAVNPAVCRLWGRAEQDLVGSPGLELVHPDDRAEAAGQLRELLAGRAGLVRREQRFVRPGGNVVWAEWLIQAAGGDGGSPRYLQWVVVDVTERKQAEAARSWMAAVVEASRDAIVGTTVDGVITAWNAGAQRIFGYTAQQMVGRNAAVLRPPGSEAEAARPARRAGHGERLEYRAVGVRKDGSTVTLLSASTPILDASGAVIGTATVARDLGEREQAGAMFRSLVEAAPDAMVCVDGQGVITLVNAQAERLFGYARGELIGCPVQMLVPEHAKDIHPGHQGGYLAGPVPRPMDAGQDLTARRKDGSVFPAEISLSSIQTHDGTLVTATVRDRTERQRAAIVASSADAIVGQRLDGTITSWNAGAERLYGYTAAEAIGSALAMLEPPERSGELAGLTESVRRGEPAGPYETQRVRKDGTRIEVSVTLSPIRDAAGAVVGTSAVARDITESKRALEALRTLAARKSAILESALDCWIIMDHQGRVVEFNPAAERVFGFRRDQVLGQQLAELIIPPPLREGHRAGLARYLATGEGPVLGQHLELTAIRADGSEFPVELAITKVELPGPPVFTGCLRDLTDRKKAEQEQQALGERLRRFLADESDRLRSVREAATRIYEHLHAPAIISEAVAALEDHPAADRAWVGLVTGEELNSLGAEPAQGRMRGALPAQPAYSLEWVRELFGQRSSYCCQDLSAGIPANLPPHVQDMVRDSHAASLLLTPFGTGRELMGVLALVRNKGGRSWIEPEIEAVQSLARDIGRALAHARLYEAEERHVAELRSLDRAKARFLASSSHDLRTPLTSIIGNVEIIQDKEAGPLTAQQSAMLDAVNRNGRRLLNLIEDMLTISKIELGAFTSDLRPMDLGRLIPEPADMIMPSMRDAGITFEVSPPGEGLMVNGDAGQLGRVLMNLLTNALKYTPQGGRVTCTAAAEEDDAVLIVQDTGMGIPEGEQESLGTPFFRASNAVRHEIQGSGLGLSIVRTVVGNHNGTVELESVEGAGTKVTVRIPLVRPRTLSGAAQTRRAVP